MNLKNEFKNEFKKLSKVHDSLSIFHELKKKLI